jgi:hypothetical protein
LVRSPTVIDFERDWNQLQDQYRDEPELIGYLKRTWIDSYKHKLIKCWTDKALHLGHRVTSRVEGAHSVLKSYLQVATGDLKLVLDNIERLLLAQQTELDASLGEAKLRPGHDLQIPLLSEVLGHTTPYALRKITQQHRILGSPTFQPQCSKLFTSSMGLPCVHKLKELKDSGEALQLSHIHQHWHFVPPHQPFTIQLSLREPLVAAVRGRPAQSRGDSQPAKSTQRNPSHFELEQLQVKRTARTTAQTIAQTTAQTMTQTMTQTIARTTARTSQREKAVSSRRLPASQTTTRKNWHRSTSDDGHDSDEDRLVALELARLQESGGSSDPLWSTIPEFRGMTRATMAYSLRSRNKPTNTNS